MDDFVLSNLHESRNEWCSRLVSVFCPLVIEGMKSIFNEAWKICNDTNEPAKYLMTFQNFLSRVPKWNSVIVEEERKRIIERSGCNYLEDLITCVHIIQLKVLTCIRVGNKQKQIDITIPKLDHFIHKVYIHVARKLYTNIYLFEKNISPLQMQKNGRELELIVQECIMSTIRESIPTEEIIRAYMDESIEHEEEVTIEPFAEPVVTSGADQEDDGTGKAESEEKKELPKLGDETLIVKPKIQDLDDKEVVTAISFNDIDQVVDTTNKIMEVNAPKTIERLEEISVSNALQRKLEEEDDIEERIQIHADSMDLGNLGITDLNSNVQNGDIGLANVTNDDIDIGSLGIETI
jgi:Family of unknown function (DUF5764)